jgi:ABC-2 type transport system permease protein
MNRWISIRQLWQLFTALFREIIREPGVLFWGILFPILMALGLGIAFAKKADVTRKIAIVPSKEMITEQKGDSVITKFLELNCEKNDSQKEGDWKWRYIIKDNKLGNSIFLFYHMQWNEAMMLLKRGTLNVLVAGSEGKAEYHFDPMNADAELTYLKLSSIIGEGKILTVKSNAEIRPLTVTGTRYIDFLVPGLISMGIMMSCMWGISYGIIEKRSKKLLLFQ